MKVLLRTFALASLALVNAFAINLWVNPGIALAQDEQPANQEPAPAVTYNYTAQPKDSYAKIARKAVQTFGVVKQVNLSQAQIIAAETYLTQAAGSPELIIGQAIAVSESDVDAAIKKAQALSQEQIALWQKYTIGVDFNTDKVGQA